VAELRVAASAREIGLRHTHNNASRRS
jgi:hypothetical protein